MAARTRPDALIMQRVAKDNQFAAASSYASTMQSIASVTSWHEGKQKFDYAEGEKRTSAFIKEEMRNCNEELKIRRRQRLRLLYDAEAKQYEEELAQMGLAVQRQYY
mmetsp:Transcript_58388/g.131543  ORF Transcript_58388/g.131543 Transcript_58388/m.131543 type:complete len:107 (+) Transcript_58388:92-412(+)|eukprot:CAMPEP_0197887780 /NCGR_PEP_ID=MMETSP1439-20131203/19605_1 /TAXON_ID=66791 /ORGANISM="Gonyaulax spinifera, Strain CCMP409" /LENGTH=106 /DNA_ID=CAMNT_0043507635 /DNA_START=92 /DNA_END=412 /DNA_ORIENTATION=+